MGFAKFMAGTAGRAIRIIAGLALIAAGLLLIEGTAGYVIAVIGVVPVLAGVFDFCLLAPLLGAPFTGEAVRNS